MKKFTKLFNPIREIHFGVFTLLLCLTSMLFATSSSAQTLFLQDFSSSTTLSNYINNGAPSVGQFNAITTSGSSTASIAGNALRFVRGSGTTSFSRSTGFGGSPTAIIYSFDLNVSGTPSGNVGTTATWQIGSGYSSATNGVETNANTYAQMAIDFRGTSNFRFNDISNGNTSSNYSVGTTVTITWVMNNSGATISYVSPSGTTETVANDRMDFWTGTTRLYNDVTIQTNGGTISDMKFAYTGSTGTITIDNISVQALVTPQASGFSGNTICNGGTGQLTLTTSAGTGPFTVIYNDGTADRTATNVSSGIAFNVFSNPTSTTNYTLISVAEASGAIRASGFTDNAATLTVNGPTANAGSSLSAICQSGTSAALGGSVGGTATSGTWSDGGVGGTFTPSATNLNATWTAPLGYTGTTTLTITTSGGSCGTTAASKTIVVNGIPTANAGGITTICPGTTAVISGANATNGTISWSENGAGSITAGGTTLTPTYTSVAGDAGTTVTLTMTVTNSACSVATATYTVVVSPAAPAAAGTIVGSTSVCAGVTSLNYSITTVANATNYSWTVPSGWNITAGQGTASITATAGGAGAGDITVVASNSCGSANPTTIINIFPSNATNNTGFVTSSAKTDNGIQCNATPTERRGFMKFPLTAIPAGATIVSSSLRLTNNSSLTSSAANNDVKPLGNTDPEAGTSTASVLFNAIGAQNSGTFYSRTTWSNTGVITLALGSNATTDIQSRFASPGYIAMGLARGGTAVFNLFGYSSGANAPRLDVIYTAPRSLSVMVNPLTTNGDVTTSICAGDSFTWPANGQSYTTEQNGTIVVFGCNTATLNLTINPITTNGDVTTSICSGATYVWPANGQSYIVEQIGTTSVSGCNTATLNLTVIPSTTGGSLTTSACDSYTWALNSQSYSATGIYTHVVGCNTATLDLTIVPSTTNGNITTSACDVYTWTENNQTYTTSGVYANVVGCNTATLDLTIVPSTTIGSATVNACVSYTWAENGQTYTSSGVYTHVVGCNTATLNITVNTTPLTFYADTDGDGFGSGAAILSCTTQPANTSLNSTDCAPGDSSKWRTANFYIDVDGDSFNNGFPAVSVCYGATIPSGYVSTNNGVDCDDNSATSNPNASEVLGNGIDDNCDGVIDEVTQTSNLVATQCGITLTSLVNTLFAYNLATYVPQLGPIQGYRFRVTNGATVRTFDSPTVGFNLMNLPGGATYGTAYTVEVSAKSRGFYRAYGAPCIVNTPAVPYATFIVNPISGSTLSDVSSSIFCQRVPTASGYRFRVKEGNTIVGIYSSPINRFSLVNLGIANVNFATTYTIDVLLKFGNDWRSDTEYGPAALITTPATPGTSRVIRPICGTTINAIWTTIFAQQIVGAQGYKFVVTNGAQTREFATANPRLQLPMLPGGAAANTAYTVRVDVLYNGSYVEGNILCTLTTSPAATRQSNAVVTIYEVNAYPNPYAETFKLNVNTSSEDVVKISVYDLLGREVESRQANLATFTNLEIGAQYPSGVYNIIVSQGENLKALRVIKR